MAAAAPTVPTFPVSDRTGNAFGFQAFKNADGYLSRFSPGGINPTYRYVVQAFAMVATPTAAIIIKGSDAMNGRLKKLRLGGAATAYGSMAVRIDRWGDAGTIGSAVLSAAIAAAKHDTKNPSPNISVFTVGTANWTTRATALTSLAPGRVDFTAIGSAATSSASGNGQGSFGECAQRGVQDWTIRGAADWIVVDFLGSAIPSGGVLDAEIEIEEDPNL